MHVGELARHRFPHRHFTPNDRGRRDHWRRANLIDPFDGGADRRFMVDLDPSTN